MLIFLYKKWCQWSQPSLHQSNPVFKYPIQFENSYLSIVFGDISSGQKVIISVDFRILSDYDLTKEIPIIIDYDSDAFYSWVLGY